MDGYDDPFDCADDMGEVVGEMMLHVQNVQYHRESELAEDAEFYRQQALDRLTELNDLVGCMEELVEEVEPNELVEVNLLEDMDDNL